MSRYADAHSAPKGPGDARPTALQIVKDEGLEGKLIDKVVLITGCSSGLGIETARAIAATGARIFAGVRNVQKGEDALSDILKSGKVELLKMDLNSLESVRAAAEVFKSRSEKLNIMINNAGVMATPQGKTADGFETQFGTNHLAHFLLFQLLKPLLLSSSTPAFPSRVVALSSSGHRTHGIFFDDYNIEKTAYNPWVAYGQSKTANIYLANEIERRYGDRGLHGYSLHPGGIQTGLQNHLGEDMQAMMKQPDIVRNMKSPEQGAATSVYTALSREAEGRGGRFFEDCAEAPPVGDGKGMMAVGYATWAYHEEGEKKLWKDSLKMVGLEDDV
ncbi:uncharacterized protein KY384_004803 [Bacidia gigantensis]|uniref:uncharacterized protein n=1 Tax=Bacidia gigantensis TaxID=2732470 RepID=UPI001D04A969|nr:uncharacterized protein KY384_004803 [Bacidia gigantensis]KAG8530301.1 hypothetical protein KY384_004803 [Bacidia gigantensis]